MKHSMDSDPLIIEVAGRRIGPGQPVLVIAEAGVNHNGDIAIARQLVRRAAEAGADAVKFQTFRADRVVSPAAPKAEYQLETTDPSESQADMLARLELTPEMHREIQDCCAEAGVLFLSTPFDEESVELLDKLGVPAFKTGSGEITNWPFLECVARRGKPVILSTGMSDMSEVEDAVRIIRTAGNERLVLLHCTSSYPADPAHVNLRAIPTMAERFRVPVGYSDHTVGTEAAIAAVALGACVVEKHFTMDRNLPGPDHRASLEPDELGRLVAGIRTVERALGNGVKTVAAGEEMNRTLIRRSLTAAVSIPKGTVIQADMLRSLRPGTGISPSLIERVVGRRAAHALAEGQLLDWEDLE